MLAFRYRFLKKSGKITYFMNVGDKVRAVRDFSVEPFFDQGWEVKKGMVGFVYAIDLGDGEIAVDFNQALGGGGEKGDTVLIVPLDAIESVNSFS